MAEKLMFDIIDSWAYDNDGFFPLSFDSKLEMLVQAYSVEGDMKMGDLTDIKIAVAGLGALIEVVNQVMGGEETDTRFAKMSFTPVIKMLNELNTQADHLCSAHSFLAQAETHLRLRHYRELVEVLSKVNTSATYALNSSGTNKIDELVMAVKLLILVDVFSQSIAPSKKMNGDPDLKLVPLSDLERTKRGNMVIHAASHLQILVNRLNKIGLPLDGLRKVLTLIYKSEEVGKATEVYDKCVQWVTPKTEVVCEDTFIVTLPPLNLVPDVGGKSGANMNLSFPGVNGSEKHALSLCTEERLYEGRMLNLGYFGIIYSIRLSNTDHPPSKYVEDDAVIEITIEGNKIVATSCYGNAERYRDMTDMEFDSDYAVWTPIDIRSVAPCVLSGDVSSVTCMALYHAKPRYTEADMWEAVQIAGVTKSLYLCGASLPDSMDYDAQWWQELVYKAKNMDNFMFVASVADTEAVHEVAEACEYFIARLVISSKKAGLMNIKISNFERFREAVATGLEEEGNTCEQMGFKYNSTNKWMKDEIMALKDYIGWKEKEDPFDYDVEIVK
jgi:hypothetical protein